MQLFIMPYAPLLFFNFAVVKRAQTGVRLNVCVCVWDEQKVCRWKDYWRFLSGEQSHCLGGKYVHGNWKDGRRNSKWPFLCSFIHFSLKTKTKKQWCFDAVCSLFSDSFSQLLKKSDIKNLVRHIVRFDQFTGRFVYLKVNMSAWHIC